MTSKEILNMKVKDLIEYCENNVCSQCLYQNICIFIPVFTKEEYTLVSILASNIREMEENEN